MIRHNYAYIHRGGISYRVAALVFCTSVSLLPIVVTVVVFILGNARLMAQGQSKHGGGCGAGYPYFQGYDDCKHVVAYVANFLSTSVSVIDTETSKVVDTIALPQMGVGPTGIVITPDGTRAYVGAGGATTVVVRDTVNNKVVTSIPVGGLPFGVASTPDGRLIYIANPASDVSVIDTTRNEVVATVPTNRRLKLSPSSRMGDMSTQRLNLSTLSQ
jgi:YVTN family beta-propeller protein